MESNSVIGIFLVITALMILVPVILQIRDGRFRLAEVWGIFVLVGGFVIVGIGYAFYAGPMQQRVALGGLAAVLIGLFIQNWKRNEA